MTRMNMIPLKSRIVAKISTTKMIAHHSLLLRAFHFDLSIQTPNNIVYFSFLLPLSCFVASYHIEKFDSK